MLGRTPDGIITISPIKDGVIANFKVAECLLRHLIGKAIGASRYRRCRMILSVPSVITPVEKRAVVDSAIRACGAQVYLVDQAMAAAIGADLPVIEAKGSMVVDIGGGTTDIAVISLSGLVCSQTVRLAGNAMDAAIKDYVRKRFDLIIGESTAEQFKIHMGADALRAQAASLPVNGRARIEGLPATASISCSDLTAAIEEPINTIVAGVRATLERIPPELSGDIADHGITLTGGGALIPDIGRRIEKETRIRTRLAGNPLKSVVVGGGALLRQKRLLERVMLNW
jgi:rod shape-determining protein MreB